MFYYLAQPKTYSIRAVANEKYLSVPFNSELLKANKHKIGHFDKFQILKTICYFLHSQSIRVV